MSTTLRNAPELAAPAAVGARPHAVSADPLPKVDVSEVATAQVCNAATCWGRHSTLVNLAHWTASVFATAKQMEVVGQGASKSCPSGEGSARLGWQFRAACTGFDWTQLDWASEAGIR